METGAVAGILKGLFSISPFGINVFSFLTAGLLSGFLRKKLFRHNFVTQFMLSNLSVYLLAGIVFFISDRMFLNDKAEFWKLAFYKGLYTGALAPFVFFILSGIFGNRNLNLDEN